VNQHHATCARQRGTAAMMLVLWSFVAVFYLLFAPQIAASAKAYDALGAAEQAYLDDIALRLETFYRRNAAVIDSASAFAIPPATLWAQLGIQAKPTLQLGISERLSGSEVGFRRFVVWLKRRSPDPSVFVATSGAFTPGPDVPYRVVDGEAIQGALREETLRRMKTFAAQLEQRFRAKFEGDPLRSLSVNHFRALGPSCSAALDDIPCIDVHTDVNAAANFGMLLSTDPLRLTSAWGARFSVSNLEDSRATAPPYTMAIRAALPWGGSLLVNAIQPLN
jgi:hypothetical protein